MTESFYVYETQVEPEAFRTCTECGDVMIEGFVFESDGTQYCSRPCMEKNISWEAYLHMHDGGNGDAYWTDWHDEEGLA